MPTRLPIGMAIAACRADPRDAFISPLARRLADTCTAGGSARYVVAAPRGVARHDRPDLTVVDLRSVSLRLRRLADDGAQAIVLTRTPGSLRLGLAHKVTVLLDAEDWLPAVGRG